MLEAIFLSEGVAPPSREIISLPELQLYIADFGTQQADVAVVAEVDNKIVGAAWSRIVKDYGHIDERTPSLSVQKANYAGEWYLKMGFKIVKENKEDYVMVCDL